MPRQRPASASVLVPPSGREVIGAAGGLLWRDGPRGPQLMLIRRQRYGPEWTLPKGKLEPRESWIEAALREVEEETGCRGRPRAFAGCICYLVGGTPKVVLYWHLELRRESKFTPGREVKERRWVSVSAALKLLRHSAERRLVRTARRPRGD